MSRREEQGSPKRSLLYCVVPRELAVKLHDLLRRHFRDDPSVEVIVEQRTGDRRRTPERRLAAGRAVPDGERRRVASGFGRRIADRRALVLPASAPPLPRKAQPFADRLVFLERLEPSTQQLEDRDTARLVARVQAGERELFTDLYTRYFDRVYSYLRLLLGDPTKAEDATQQVFVSVLEALPRYERRRQPFRSWLFVIARNRALDELRKQQRIKLVDPADLAEGRVIALPNEPALGTLRWITDRELLMLMERLPIIQQQVLMLRFALDLSHAETATILGRTSEDVRVIQHRALGFLKARLVSLGRESPSSQAPRMSRVNKHATVLRRRRFALMHR
jgi:RNA polymerase sigma-70 factor, ECF subfamily